MPDPGERDQADLDSRSEIHHDLVVGFYRELVFDDLLGAVFNEVAEVDWSAQEVPAGPQPCPGTAATAGRS